MHSQTETHSIPKFKLKVKCIYTFLFLVVWLRFVGPADAQSSMEVGLFGGDAYYIGDLNPGTPFRMAQIAYGVMTKYNVDDRWSVKLAITHGNVKGNSGNTAFLPGRDLSFITPITDFSLMAEFNFFPYFIGSRWNWITPYLYAGIGGFTFQPTSGGVNLQPLGTEGQKTGYDGRKPYSTLGVNIPFGLGVKISIGRRIGLTTFWEMHKTFTDYIDDVSTTYYLNGSTITAGDVGANLSDPTHNHLPGMQRGNPNTKDWYSFSGVTLTYKFDLKGSRKCKENRHF
jgi:hypothetical protein